MWDRTQLKTRAKQTLKGHYWSAFAAALVLTLATGFGSGAGGNLTYYLEEEGRLSPQMTAGLVVLTVVLVLGGLAFQVFVASPLSVGVCRYFTSACCRSYDLGNLGFGFRYNYGNCVKTQLIVSIKIVLWSLLLIIPGIVKALSYSMVPYLLADNPNLSPRRAQELSRRMTNGYKGEIFVLELSFIGWYLLGGLLCGVGALFVDPYKHSAMAEAYMQLRHNALQNGLTTMEELCLVRN